MFDRSRNQGHTYSAFPFAPLLLGALLAALFGSLLLTGRASARYADEAAWLYEPNHVVEIDLDLPPASWDALVAEPDEYAVGDLTVVRHDPAQTYVRTSVGVKLKGHLSFRPLGGGKSAFKIKLDEFVDDQTLLGLEKLTLNNMVQDPSMIHELLAYEAFRAAGVPGWRTGYAFLRVNGDDYGVYLNLETPDEIALELRYRSTQHLYEGEVVDVVPGSLHRFAVDEGDEEDLADLRALIRAVNGNGDFSDRVHAVARLRQLTRMWATEKYIGHWDSYSGGMRGLRIENNYYLHSNDRGRFAMLPWGTDQTWHDRVAFDGKGGVMFNRCLRDDSCFALYRHAVREARSDISKLDLDSLAEDTATMLAPWQERDPRREYSLEEIENAVTSTGEFVALRPADADAWLSSTRAP